MAALAESRRYEADRIIRRYADFRGDLEPWSNWFSSERGDKPSFRAHPYSLQRWERSPSQEWPVTGQVNDGPTVALSAAKNHGLSHRDPLTFESFAMLNPNMQ